MKKISFLIVLCTFFSTKAQVHNEYDSIIQKAWSEYEIKDYSASALNYSKAFSLNGLGYDVDRYNAACSWSQAGNSDSAFYYLNKVAFRENNKGYSNLGHVTKDTDLTQLHTDPRWEKFIEQVKANKFEQEKNLDHYLVNLLDSIYHEDQFYRHQIDSIQTQFGWESDEMKAHWKIISEKDSLNLIIIKGILDEKGWLGPDVVGGKGSSTLFLVIQHADLETQLLYLPMMREAVKLGKANGSSLALLEDRVALRTGQPQIYGSQLASKGDGEYYVSAMIDPDNIDVRRKEVGLGPIAEYISFWGLEWNLEEYKKNLPEYLELLKKNN